MSLAASFMSSNTLLGAPAEVYLLGTQFGVNMLMVVIAAFVGANLFMPLYYDLELTSVNKYLLRRFNTNTLRVLGSLTFIISTLPYMAAVLYGPAIALSSGPLLGIFCLGIFGPCINAKGAIAGLLTASAMTMTIAIGSVVNKKPQISLDLKTDRCDFDIIGKYGFIEKSKNYTLPGAYSPQ
ncbi:sodium-coupled monocarboxylate transporter 1-like protein 2 [Dinothrombium tinctorium]|uniref:Sodium-coupled monocarboxylate transporter 1-like protein 2 n=1 Tax=Dinothrombium tinctorium TaxID=1965070 RepID=A0A443R266_9ACAR|nr:sodium-coupled monocarboxylate transporter 1-like protein 2 [Dinothrombium tinctorium]